MSDNRIRPQFSSLSFNFGDPLGIVTTLPPLASVRLDHIAATAFAGATAQTYQHLVSGLLSPFVVASAVPGPAVRHAHTVSQPFVTSGHDHLADLGKLSAFNIAGAPHARYAPLADHSASHLGISGVGPVLAGVHFGQQAQGADSSGQHDPSGQLWFGVDDLTHTGLDHIDSDAAGHDTADHPTDGTTFASVALDPAAGLYFGYTRDGYLRDGHITNDQEAGQASEIQEVLVQYQYPGDPSFNDEVNAIAIDPVNHIIFVGLWGQEDQYTGILEVTYNPTTGALTSPYNAATGVVTDFNHMLFHDDNNGLVNGVTAMTNIIAMQYDLQNGNLYYVDQTNIWGGSNTSTLAWAQRNGIFVVSTSGSVGGGSAPTPVQLSLNSQFAAGDNNNYIEGLAINEAQGIIYFAVNNASNSTSKLYYMPIAGGTATQMALPGGVGAFFVDDQGTGVNPIAFDPNQRQIYLSDNTHSQLVQLTLSADGHTFTAGNADFLTIDHTVPGSGPTSLYFDPLPTLSALSATSTEAVQGGSAITLLTAAPTITDPQDGVANKVHMGFLQVVITNAQAGDNLFYSGAQSGTFDSGKMTISWNSSTHTLTLTGNETEAFYDTLFQNITYQDSGTDNSVGSHPTRTVDWIISDGITTVNHTGSDPNLRATTVVIDRAPTLTADSYAVVETATVTGTSGTGGTGVLGNDTDKDADAIVVTAVQGSGANVGNSVAGTYGHLTLNSNGSYSYSADNTAAIDAAPNGSHPVDTFTYTVSDGLGGVTTSTVSFTIDRPPTVVADNPTGQALEGGVAITGNVLTNDSDKDGDSLTVSAVNGSGANVGNSIAGTYGHITINSNGTYSYSADNTAAIDGAATGSHLTDSFTYTDSDGHGGTTTTTITVTIDRPPTVVADNPAGQALESGSAITGNVLTNDSDRDGDSLVVSAVAGSGANVGNSVATTYGHITINSDGTYSYAANNTVAIDAAATGSHLTDTVNYTASDSHGGTTTTSITLTLDRGPTVVTDSDAALEGASAAGGNVLTNDSDRDGDSLVISAVAGSGANVGNSTATTYGHITVNADGSYSYTADNTAAIDAAAAGSHPVDSISITADDGHGGTTTETLNITIDRPPVVTADNPTGEALESGGAITGNVLTNDSDTDADSLTVSAVAGSGANVGNSIAGTYGHITINSNGSYSYSADNSVAIDAAAAGSHLTDTFAYTADDGQGGTTTSSITVTIDRAPDVVADNPAGQAVESGSAITGNVLTNDSDRDGDSLVVSAVAGSGANVGNSVATTYGHFTINSDGSYSYSADNTAAIDGAATGAHLTDSVNYTASDGLGGTTTTSITVTIDRGPTVVDDSDTAVEGGSAVGSNVLTNDSDRDGDSLVISAVAGSGANVGISSITTYGHITVNADGSYIYTADDTAAINVAAAGSHPHDLISITADDGNGGTTTETLNIAIDRAALAQDDDTSTDEATPLSASVFADNGHGADTDPDGDTLAVAAVNGNAGDVGNQITLASGALLTLNADGTFDYDPNHVFDHLPAAASGGVSTATDSFTYTLAGGDTATVTVTINGVDSNDTIDGTAGPDTFFGGIGDDTITGAAGNDVLNGQLGHDTIHGGDNDDRLRAGRGIDHLFGDNGDDVLVFGGGHFGTGDIADGGAGFDQLLLRGDYNHMKLGALSSIEEIKLDAGFSYHLVLADADVAAGDNLVVNASHLGASDHLFFNGSQETDGTFELDGGAGNDMLRGGSGADRIYGNDGNDRLVGGAGADILKGGAGNDSFVFASVADSNASAMDNVRDFDADHDTMNLWFHVKGIDATQSTTGLGQLGTVFDAPHLGIHHAALATIGVHTYMVIDANGIAGYQSGQDLLIQVDNITGTLDTGDFV